METPFIFDKPVSGRYFLGRKKDVEILRNLLSGGTGVALFDNPGTGKASLLNTALLSLRLTEPSITPVEMDFFNCRTTESILKRYATAVLNAFHLSEDELQEAVKTLLAGTHFVFDRECHEKNGDAVSSNWPLDEIDFEKVLELPYVLATKNSRRLIIVMKEFQNILDSKDCDSMLEILEKIVRRMDKNLSFVFLGSRLNAMKHIFCVRKFFWRDIELFRMTPIDPQAVAEYVNRGFLLTGKVVKKDDVLAVYNLFKGNMMYVNRYFFLLDTISKGYITDNLRKDALECLVAAQRPRFIDWVYSLTDFQINMLRAVVDGVTHFSSSAIIDKYELNSSANVKRVKDALVKKEILSFDDDDIPHIEDPLFEYWLRETYFR